MLLLKIGEGGWGTVLATCSDRGDCETLDFLGGLGAGDQKDAAKMLGLLQQRVPTHGPPVHNTEVSRPLRDGIFELKQGAIRIFFFYSHSTGALVICTHGYYKTRRRTPPSEIERAIRIAGEYEEARAKGEVTVMTWDQED